MDAYSNDDHRLLRFDETSRKNDLHVSLMGTRRERERKRERGRKKEKEKKREKEREEKRMKNEKIVKKRED